MPIEALAHDESYGEGELTELDLSGQHARGVSFDTGGRSGTSPGGCD